MSPLVLRLARPAAGMVSRLRRSAIVLIVAEAAVDRKREAAPSTAVAATRGEGRMEVAVKERAGEVAAALVALQSLRASAVMAEATAVAVVAAVVATVVVEVAAVVAAVVGKLLVIAVSKAARHAVADTNTWTL
eukprot:3406010-Pleurochrysis_carterae.AAC.1